MDDMGTDVIKEIEYIVSIIEEEYRNKTQDF